MAAATGLMVAGTALSIFGNIQANFAQARAEEQNAMWLEEQAAFMRESTNRSLDIYQRQAGNFKEEQLDILGSANVEMSGSASDIYNDTLASISQEFEAIQRQGEMQEREALLKASTARGQAATLRDPLLNILQAAGPALTTAGNIKGRG